MSLQQDIKFVMIGKFIATQCVEVHTKNCELSTHVHREVEEESVVSALRDAINKNLYKLQSFNGAECERRCNFQRCNRPLTSVFFHMFH